MTSTIAATFGVSSVIRCSNPTKYWHLKLCILCKYPYLSMILTMACYPNRFEMYYLKTALQDPGIITRQNNLIPQSRPRTTFSSKLHKHTFTRIWNKTGSTLAHGKNILTFKRLLKNSYIEDYESQIQCINPRCTDCYDKLPSLGV